MNLHQKINFRMREHVIDCVTNCKYKTLPKKIMIVINHPMANLYCVRNVGDRRTKGKTVLRNLK